MKNIVAVFLLTTAPALVQAQTFGQAAGTGARTPLFSRPLLGNPSTLAARPGFESFREGQLDRRADRLDRRTDRVDGISGIGGGDNFRERRLDRRSERVDRRSERIDDRQDAIESRSGDSQLLAGLGGDRERGELPGLVRADGSRLDSFRERRGVDPARTADGDFDFDIDRTSVRQGDAVNSVVVTVEGDRQVSSTRTRTGRSTEANPDPRSTTVSNERDSSFSRELKFTPIVRGEDGQRSGGLETSVDTSRDATRTRSSEGGTRLSGAAIPPRSSTVSRSVDSSADYASTGRPAGATAERGFFNVNGTNRSGRLFENSGSEITLNREAETTRDRQP